MRNSRPSVRIISVPLAEQLSKFSFINVRREEEQPSGQLPSLGATRFGRKLFRRVPDENSWVQSYHVGEIADDTYRITRWEGQLIDAVPLNNSACRTTQLSLNFETKEFFEIARNNTAGDCETMLGVTLPRLEKPRVSRIVDGREIVSAEFKAISEETFTFFSSSFRNIVNTKLVSLAKRNPPRGGY